MFVLCIVYEGFEWISLSFVCCRNFPSLVDSGPFGGSCQIHGPVPPIPQPTPEEMPVSDDDQIKSPILRNPAFSHSRCPPEIHKSCFCVRFIAEHTKMLEDSTKVRSVTYFDFFFAYNIKIEHSRARLNKITCCSINHLRIDVLRAPISRSVLKI